MRCALVVFVAFMIVPLLFFAQQPSDPATPKTYTLTIVAEGVDQRDGYVGTLLFNKDKGWPESVADAFKDVRVPAHQGTVTIKVEGVPPGDYAAVVLHDVNGNKKLEKNWIGKPQEQWGMSNNPHATLKAPSFSKAKFTLSGDTELHIQMQQ